MKVLVTGASGFVGGALVSRLAGEPSVRVRAAYRRAPGGSVPAAEQVVTGDLGAATDWSRALVGCDAVVHAAARVHVVRETANDPLAEFRAVNVAGTLRLASEAAAAGVRRFVFVSSVKVNGEETVPGHPFRIADTPAPVDPYGISKHEAEAGLWRIAAESGLEVVIVRPVLVYGPGVKANFETMLRWLDRQVPLPLAAIDNRRSLVAIDNLTDVLTRCLMQREAGGHTFFASDDDDVSTPELLRRAAAALGRRPRLVPVPRTVLRAAAAAAGRSEAAARLIGSLQVDVSETRTILGWAPVVTMREALARTATDFHARHTH